jgi:hypothetical protein
MLSDSDKKRCLKKVEKMLLTESNIWCNNSYSLVRG